MKWFLIFIIFFLNSCYSGKAVTFLKQCQSKIWEEKVNGCPTSIVELKKNLSKNAVLHYMGSNGQFHFLKYYYDKGTKISTVFSLLSNDFTPKRKSVFTNDKPLSEMDKYYLEKL